MNMERYYLRLPGWNNHTQFSCINRGIRLTFRKSLFEKRKNLPGIIIIIDRGDGCFGTSFPISYKSRNVCSYVNEEKVFKKI